MAGPEDAVEDDHAPPVGVDVAELGREVGVGAVEEAQSFTLTGPVISMYLSNTGDVNSSTSGRSSTGRWSLGPLVPVRLAPPTVGTGFFGSYLYESEPKSSSEREPQLVVRVEIDRHHLGGDRPVVGRLPLVAERVGVGRVAHREVLHGGDLLDSLAVVLEPDVEPVPHVGARGMVGVGEDQVVAAAVPVGLHDEPALAPRRLAALLVDRDEAVDRAGGEDIVPAAEEHRRHVHLGGDPLGVERLPEIVVVGWARNNSRFLGVNLLCREPVLEQALAEGPALVGGLSVHVREGHADVAAGQVGRPAGGRHVQGDARGADAPSADLAVGPLLCRDPLDGVVPVLVLAPAAGEEDGVVLALGGEPAPEVLGDEDISALAGLARDGLQRPSCCRASS